MLKKALKSLLFLSASIIGSMIGLVAVIIILFEKENAHTKKPLAFFATKKRAMIFYRFLSKAYDIINPLFYDGKMRDTIMQWTSVSEVNTSEPIILDVGCGTGYTTEGLLKEFSHSTVVCLDITLQQLRKAFVKFNRREKVMFVRGDAENLPFRENLFAMAISFGSIEHWPNPVKVVKEMSNVAKIGAKVVIGGPERRWFKKFLLDKVLNTPSVNELRKFFIIAKLKEIRSLLTGVNTYFGTGEYAIIVSGIKSEFSRQELPHLIS